MDIQIPPDMVRHARDHRAAPVSTEVESLSAIGVLIKIVVIAPLLFLSLGATAIMMETLSHYNWNIAGTPLRSIKAATLDYFNPFKSSTSDALRLSRPIASAPVAAVAPSRVSEQSPPTQKKRERCGFDDDLNLQLMQQKEEQYREHYGREPNFTCYQLTGTIPGASVSQRIFTYKTEAIRSLGLLESVERFIPGPARACRSMLDHAHMMIDRNQDVMSITDRLDQYQTAYEQCSNIADGICENHAGFNNELETLCRLKRLNAPR